MTNDQYLFLIDLLAQRDELDLIKSLIENPNDKTLRDVYHDFLLDNGRSTSADLIKNKRFTPGGQSEPMGNDRFETFSIVGSGSIDSPFRGPSRFA